ncbi:iron-containing alcohol dehydrogenase [Cryobacterium glaciale]|uniref:Iron-containing alcohol dehydrogenase n=1 Tax=Cryobacterium glaciale TaxID=1259145 RepID=A0A4R8V2J1_9MICO|nr:iron-containing alcohol dehydrogenase [Cryobacterium glaciale]TFB76479.1 iron-containing alcohol dehydrogenase [Cryobacterium glaciale]
MTVPSIDNQLGLGLLRQPRSVFFGPGQRRQIPFIVEPLGTSVLICTDERMVTTAEFRDVVQSLESRALTVQVFSSVEPDLPRSNVLALQERFTSTGIEVIVGLGGGSCLDMAKVAGLLLSRGGDVRDYYGENLVEGPGLPVVTVPTTGGTGAEVSCIAVVFDADRGMKIGVASAYLEPVAAVVDPELTLTCPPGLTAATGADALSHLIETFTDRSKNPSPEELAAHLYVGKNVLTDIYCRHGLSLLATSLERIVADPSDLQARSDTMLAAFCGGMALNTAGTAGIHAIQSPIGNLTHTPHGFGVGALLPYLMRYNLPVRQAEFAEIGRILGVATDSQTELEQARAAIVRVEQILAALGVPLNLKELGLEPEDFEFVADQALLASRLTANNPRPLTKENIVAILERGYADDRSWWRI